MLKENNWETKNNTNLMSLLFCKLHKKEKIIKQDDKLQLQIKIL